jgi:hypothetical protein
MAGLVPAIHVFDPQARFSAISSRMRRLTSAAVWWGTRLRVLAMAFLYGAMASEGWGWFDGRRVRPPALLALARRPPFLISLRNPPFCPYTKKIDATLHRSRPTTQKCRQNNQLDSPGSIAALKLGYAHAIP